MLQLFRELFHSGISNQLSREGNSWVRRTWQKEGMSLLFRPSALTQGKLTVYSRNLRTSWLGRASGVDSMQNRYTMSYESIFIRRITTLNYTECAESQSQPNHGVNKQANRYTRLLRIFLPHCEQIETHFGCSYYMYISWLSGVFVLKSCKSKLRIEEWCLLWCYACGSCNNRRFGGTQRLLHQGDKNRWTGNNVSS
jgi:hypothetical protein